MCLSHRHEHGLVGYADDRLPYAEPGVEPHYAPDRTVAIEHIALKLSLWPAERRFSGEAVVRFRPLPAFDGTLVLDLDEVVVDAVTDVDGAALPFHTEEGALHVRHASGPVVVRWHGEDPRHGLYFTGPTPYAPGRVPSAWTQCQDEDAHFLVPCHDHPRTKHAWTVEIEAPAGYTLLSNGVQVASGERGGRSWARYEQREPMPAYLLTVVAAMLSTVSTEWRGRPVRYLVPVGEEAAVARAMGRTPQMMEEFSAKTGVDYPWSRYDQVVVHQFIFGGMENTACTTMTRLLLVDEKAAIEWDPETLVAHELAHQWFGDLVTCQDWSQGWLNESWATFLEVVWYEKARSEAESTWLRYDLARAYFDEEGSRYRRPIVSYQFREPIDVFDRHLYEKGASVLATLRAELGEAPFWAGVQAYLRAMAHKGAHTRDFQRALEEATGRNLDRFFQQWVHAPGHPSLQVKLARESGLVTVAVKQTQSGDGVPEAFAVPLRVEIVGKDGSITAVDLPVRERERTFALPFVGEVQTVRVDAGFRFLGKVEIKAPREWLEALLGDACPVLATRAARSLVDDGSPAAIAAVIRAQAEHPFFGVRADLAAQLGGMGGPVARDALLAALRAESEPRVQRAIADGLGKFREAIVADALMARLTEPMGTWHLHGSLLVALGRTRDARAAAVIRPHLSQKGWARLVTRKATEALAETRDAAIVEDLLPLTTTDHPGRVRAAAAISLAKLADQVESVRTRVVERLIEMLAEPGFFARMGAISALAIVRDDRGVGALQRMRRTGADGRMKRMAWEAVARIQAGRTGEEAMGSLKRRLDELAEENHKLRARLDKLEA